LRQAIGESDQSTRQLAGTPDLPPGQKNSCDRASRCPASANEVIEIRQVQEMADFPAEIQEVAAKFPEMQTQSHH